MMFGSKVRYCVTYKNNENNFEVFTRKYHHDYKITFNDENFEGAKGLEIQSMQTFIVGKDDELRMFDSFTFEEVKENRIQLSLFKSEDRYKN